MNSWVEKLIPIFNELNSNKNSKKESEEEKSEKKIKNQENNSINYDELLKIINKKYIKN